MVEGRRRSSGRTRKPGGDSIRFYFSFVKTSPPAPFYCHLIFRGVKFKDYRTLDLKFILDRRFERGSGLRARSLAQPEKLLGAGNRVGHCVQAVDNDRRR